MRILIVDDDTALAHMLRDQIQRLEPDFRADAANSAETALRAVQETDAPFDVFLIDQHLEGSDMDGVTLMRELLGASPDSNAVILTGYDDQEAGLNAFAAGAYRYLSKPFDTRELIALLAWLGKYRHIKREGDWHRILAEFAKDVQRELTIKGVGKMVVECGPKLGFERSHLWLLSDDRREWMGLHQCGYVGLDNFTSLRVPVANLLYPNLALTRGETTFFRGPEYGPGYLEEHFKSKGFLSPVGEWAEIVLQAGERCIGALALDNDQKPRSLLPEQKGLLRLFGEQAAAALARAQLQEERDHQAIEWKTLSDISRAVTTQAAQGNLNQLLDEVRKQVGEGSKLDTSNFMVVLLDLESEKFDFRRQYEENKLANRHWRGASPTTGLSGNVIFNNEPRLIQNTKTYCIKHDITQYGPPAACWLGVPMRVEGDAIGAIIVQSYDDPYAYNEYHQRVLVAVAHQVAGAIRAAYRSERAGEQTRQLEALQRVGVELPRLAREDEDRFWHTVLTAITHRDGLSFNRAALLLYEEDGSRLRGRLGIGDVRREDARRAWERDEETNWSLEEYLEQPRLARLVSTPLEEITPGWKITVSETESPLYQVRDTGEKRFISSAEQAARWLPRDLAVPEGLTDDLRPVTHALIPLKLDSQVLGVVAVDNAFDGEPLYPTALTNLEDLLSQAARALNQAQALKRNQHQSERDRAILRLIQQVAARVRERPLKEGLEEFAREAKALTTADLVVIYPLRQDSDGYVTKDVAAIGLVNEEKFRATNRPRHQGVTGHILHAGILVVPDVRRSDLTFDGNRLLDHPFLLREEIRAFIGVPINEPTTDKGLGVLYLDYRSPQHFAESAVALAVDLAQAIATVIRAEQDAGGREAAEAAAWSSELELTLLHDIQKKALSPDTDEKKVIKATLINGARLFELEARLRIGMLLWETADGQARPVWYEFSLDALGRLCNHRASEAHRKIMGIALETAELQGDGHLFVIPIRPSKRVIGAIQIELSNETHFTAELAQRAERLATAAALALDNVRRLARFRAVLDAAKAVTQPSDLHATVWSVVTAARNAAPDIECVTIWYQDPITKQLLAGPQWGLIGDPDTQVQEGSPAANEGLVRRVMRAQEPIWAADVSDGRLKGDFNEMQKVISAAAFPLRVGQECVGALFFNYRRSHIFTSEERESFPIFAEIVAASIQDARKTKFAEQKQSEAERDQASLEAAARVSAAVGTSLDLPTVLESIAGELHNRFRLQGKDPIPYVMLYDQQIDALVFAPSAIKYYHIDNPDYEGWTEFPLESDIKSFSLQVARAAREALKMSKKGTTDIIVQYVNDVVVDGFIRFKLDTRSEICAGLVSGGRFLGVLVLKSSRVGAFTEEDIPLFKLVAEQVALAIERAEQAAKLRFKDAVSSVTTWAAELAHDINKEIGAIRSRADWLRDEKGMSDQGRQWAQEIDAGAARLVDVTRSVRTDQRMDVQRFDLCQMLSRRINDLMSQRWPRIKVVTEFYTPEVWLYNYSERLWRGVRHLVRNAADAMNGDGVLTIRTKEHGDTIEVQIEDTGAGVPAELRSVLFVQPYTSKGELQERGYGLLIARQLIESLGGQIHLLPQEPGRGAIFALTLPLTPERLS